MVELLLGIALAAGVFSAFLWTVHRASIRHGKWRLIHGSVALSVLLAMAALSFTQAGPLFFMTSGTLLCLCTLAALPDTPGWSKLFSLMLFLFGLSLVSGLSWLQG